MNSDRLGGGRWSSVLGLKGRRDATFIDPKRLGLASWRGRRRFALAGLGKVPA